MFFLKVSSDEEDVALVSMLYALASKKKKKNTRANRSKRSIWIRPWLLKRPNFGVYDTLLKEFRLANPEEYKNCLRMTEENFNEILSYIEADIRKEDTVIFLLYLNLFVLFSSKTRCFFFENLIAHKFSAS